jgi:hypothetical protein
LYEERVPLALGQKTLGQKTLGQKTMPPTQPESSKRRKAVFEAERTHYHERNEKAIDAQRETCETGQVANQTGYECQSPSTDAFSTRYFQASNGLIKDWKNEGEVATSQKSPSVPSVAFRSVQAILRNARALSALVQRSHTLIWHFR